MDAVWSSCYVVLGVLAVMLVFVWRKRRLTFERIANKSMLFGTLLGLVVVAYDVGYMFGSMEEYFAQLVASKNDEDNLQQSMDTLANSRPADLSESGKQWAIQVETMVRKHQIFRTWQADWPIPLAVPLVIEALVGLVALLKFMGWSHRKTG